MIFSTIFSTEISSFLLVLSCFLLLVNANANPFDDGQIAVLNDDWLNDNVQRNIDISNYVVTESRAIALKSKLQQSSSVELQDYYFVVELLANQPLNASVSLVQFEQKFDDSIASNKIQNKHTFYDALYEREVDGKRLFLFKAPVRVIGPDGEIIERPVLTIKIMYNHALEPLPKVIPQGSRELQSLVFHGSVYMNSPYSTSKQKLKVSLASTKAHQYTKFTDFDTTKNGKTIVYGPVESVDPFSSLPFVVHSVSDFPALTVTNLRRDIWINQWTSTVEVEEWWYVRHDGASLSESKSAPYGFSITDFKKQKMMNQLAKSVVLGIDFSLPEPASGVYFRDDVGNVSTSNFRSGRWVKGGLNVKLGTSKNRPSILQIRPRYPLFGGWIYAWYHGYQVPIDYFGQQDDSNVGSADYHFQLPVLPILHQPQPQPLDYLPINNLTVRFILPEGASKVNFGKSSKNIIKRWTEREYSFFDSVGREVLCFNWNDLVIGNSVIDPFKLDLEYDFPLSSYIRKPLVLCLSFIMVSWSLTLVARKVARNSQWKFLSESELHMKSHQD